MGKRSGISPQTAGCRAAQRHPFHLRRSLRRSRGLSKALLRTWFPRLCMPSMDRALPQGGRCTSGPSLPVHPCRLGRPAITPRRPRRCRAREVLCHKAQSNRLFKARLRGSRAFLASSSSAYGRVERQPQTGNVWNGPSPPVRACWRPVEPSGRNYCTTLPTRFAALLTTTAARIKKDSTPQSGCDGCSL